jgi:hypothetical protein
MKKEEYVSETTTAIENSIWRVEVIHRPEQVSLSGDFTVAFGSRHSFSEGAEHFLSQGEFVTLLETLKEASRIIEEKEAHADNCVQQKDFQADAT